MKSDFKHIVKESLREAFYTPKKVIFESINAHKITLKIDGNIFHGIISKNTTPNEKPYRVSLFQKGTEGVDAKGHFELTEKEANQILTNNKLPDDVYRTYKRIALVTTNGWLDVDLQQEQILNEAVEGKRLYIVVNMKKIPALLSKNTLFGMKQYTPLGPIEKEMEYRLTWFDSIHNMIPRGHHSFDKRAYEFIIQHQDFPVAIKKFFGNKYFVSEKDIFCQFVDKFDASQLHEEIISEELYGKRMKIMYFGNQVDGVLSKNTKTDEHPYRISWFRDVGTNDMEAEGHIDLTEEEVKYILHHKQFPRTIYSRIFVKPHNFIINQIDENLLLLEESAREVELWMENKTIDESMDIYVSGADYSRTDRFDSLVQHLDNKVVSPLLHKYMTADDQLEYFHKNSVGRWNMLVADGSYYEQDDGTKGIINFYTAGVMSPLINKILLGCLRELKRLGVTVGKMKRENSGTYKSQVIRIPVIKNNTKTYQGPPEMNLSNANAYHVFHHVLQYEGDNDFTINPKELMERIEVLAHDSGWIDKHVIKPTDSDWPEAERGEDEKFENPHMDVIDKITGGGKPGGPRVLSPGLDSDGIRFRLREIWKIAKWAVDHGKDKIFVG